MNRTEFNQTGGLRLVTNDLDFMQNAYSIFNAFTGLAGDLTIIQGCEKVGSTVTAGFVAINGEVLPFAGGSVTTNSKVIIVETKTERAFENGENKTVWVERTAKFGVGTTSYPWSDFVRIPNLKEVAEALAQATETKTGTAKLATLQDCTETDLADFPKDKIVTPFILEKTRRENAGCVTPVCAGQVFNGNKVRGTGLAFTSLRFGIGQYRVTHNLGNTNYYVQATGGYYGATIKASLIKKEANFFEVGLSDDHDLNDGGGFDFLIFK